MGEQAPVRGVIFDLDGTLLDTVEDIGRAANQALASKGFDGHAIEAYRGFVGHGALELMRRALVASMGSLSTEPDPGLVAELEQGFQEAYEDHWQSATRPYPGVDELLDKLTRKGWPMAVLSNKPHHFTVKCVEGLLHRWRFSPVLGQRAEVPKKPDPRAALDIAEAWGMAPAELAFVGDTTVDLKTAQRAGMQPFGVLWGFHDRDQLAPFALPLAESCEQLNLLLGL